MGVSRWRHLWIHLRVRHWLAPALCAFPYLLAMAWVVSKGQLWMAGLMLSPVLLMGGLGLLTWLLARAEFAGAPRRGR